MSILVNVLRETKIGTGRSEYCFGVDAEVLLYVHRNRRLIRDGEARTATSVDFHTAPELFFGGSSVLSAVVE